MKPKRNALKKKLSSIKLIVSDVDGVLTDGKICLIPQIGEAKTFSVKDSLRIKMAVKSGIPIVWFTGRKSRATIQRAKELNAEVIFKQDLKDGLFGFLKRKFGIDPINVLYVGDDWNDMWFMSCVGISAAPSDARPEVRKVASIVTKVRGGDGVLGELIEAIMRAKGTWNKYVNQYRNGFIF